MSTKSAESSGFDKKYPIASELGIKNLYKFYSFNPEHAKFTKVLFLDKKLHHNAPSNFNDPFECRPHFRISDSDQAKKNTILHLVNSPYLQDMTRDERILLALQLNNDPKLSKKTLREAFEANFLAARICCFTIKKDNLLMWSHYANSHTGYCVEFNTDNPAIKCAHKVNYSNQYPELTYPLDVEDLIVLALNKSIEWAYEDEFRLIINSDFQYSSLISGDFLTLSPPDIKSVYLGAKMSQLNKRAFLSIIKQSDFKPEIFQAKLSENSFQLVFEKVKY